MFAYGHPNVERRLDEERMQLEAKKREREEQHLFLTAKVSNTLWQYLKSMEVTFF